jgi:conserved repeat domain
MITSKTLRAKRSILAAAATALFAVALLIPASASAAGTVAWSLTGVSLPTQFAPGALNRYELQVLNTGSETSTPGVTLTDRLPAGLTMATFASKSGTFEGAAWECSEPTEAGLVSCTLAEALPPGGYAPPLEIEVSSPTESPVPLQNQVAVSGGGALRSASTSQSTLVSSATQKFGITGFDVEANNVDGSPSLQAGGHPWQVTTSFGFPWALRPPNELGFNYIQVHNLKKISVELPLGMAGNPLAVTEHCTQIQLHERACPAASKVGEIAFAKAAEDFAWFRSSQEGEPSAVFDMAPEPGYPAQLGFSFLQQPIYLDATLVHSAAGERIRFTAPALPPNIESGNVVLTLWGQPGAFNETGSTAAFITNPTRCSEEPQVARMEAESWGEPGQPVSAEAVVYPHLEGCEGLDFKPSLSLLPESGEADSPTGLNVDLKNPQSADFEKAATPELRDATVTLPQGLVADPALAGGLGACAATGPEGINLGSTDIGPFGQDTGNPFATELGAGHLGGNGSPYDDGIYHTTPGHCPLASTLGTVEVTSPIVAEPLTGHVYLGTPECAPCSNQDAAEGKLIKLYIEAEGDGAIVKLPGTVSANPSTGRLTASFKDNPQLPFEDLKLHFKSGPRAALSTPPTCGTYTTTSDLKPWSSEPGEAEAEGTPDAISTSKFEVNTGPGGGACAKTAAEEPNKPSFTAGSTNPSAGAYSPFVLKLSREDGSQRLKGLDATLPAGLVARLAGVGECSDAQIAAASQRSGAAEKAGPSCPLSSEVGTVNVGAGAGPSPFHVSGHAYLAGPYKGAPISLAVIVPAVAGPFDLGTVVVRTALYVNPETAQVTARSDPFPQILAGIPLDLRSVALNMSRPDFTLNPTSCDPMAVTGTAFAALTEAGLSSPFQVGGCGALAFKPKLAISLKGGTKRNKNPALRAVVTYPKKGAYANIARAQVTLPHSEFLDQSHIRTVCTRVQFAAGGGNGEQCPAASIYGHARAITPLLDKPLEGPVYLRSSSHKLPDLVAALNGQISVDLAGKVDTGKNGGIRNTFEMVPDAPVSKFVLSMQGGKKGLLVNSENICRKPQRASASFSAQNGKVEDLTPLIANSCGGKGKKHHRHG